MRIILTSVGVGCAAFSLGMSISLLLGAHSPWWPCVFGCGAAVLTALHLDEDEAQD